MFYDWLDIWYQTYKVPAVKAGSLRCIRNTINIHIKPNLPDCPLSSLTPLKLQQCLNAVKTTRMAEYTHNTLSDCMRRAYQLGYTKSNLMEFVPKPKHRRKLGRAMTESEQLIFLANVNRVKHWQIFLFYLYSGCRRMEALTLLWTDIDYDRKRIFIRGTKTESSERYIPLFDDIKDLLDKTPKRGSKVFAISPKTLYREFDRLRELCGFTFPLHTLRHTFCTRLHEKGVDDKAIQRWAGHSNVSTTQRIYMHLTSEQEQRQIDKVNGNGIGNDTE